MTQSTSRATPEAALLSPDSESLFSPCHCGGTRFGTNRLLRFRTCAVVKCIRCGQLRTFPEPDPDRLSEVYSRQTRKYSLESVDDAERAELWEFFAIEILSAIERVRPSQGRLLDVGCNFGDLLSAARRRGWDVEGLEINPENAEYLTRQGFTIYDTYVERAGIEDNRFDAVVINQVLEHVPEPNEFLRSMRRILKPGGVLFVGVPCFCGPIPLILKRDCWYALVPEEHIWQFCPASLSRLLCKHGFRITWRNRGCSGFWGKLSLRPKSIARWLLFKGVKHLGLGDFINVIAVNAK